MKPMKEIIKGTLYIDGCSTLELAKEFGTPLYVLSEKAILNRIDELKTDFLNKYENVRVAYGAKAFCTIGMCQICQREGLSIDVVSGGELYTALEAGFHPENIEFNGNNKTLEELNMAVENRIGRVIVDNAQEFFLLEELCRKAKTKMKVLFRINPGVDVDTHEHIITGKRDGKFGMDLQSQTFFDLVQRGLASDDVELMGLHAHIGSQIFDSIAYIEATKILLNTGEEIRRRFDFEIEEINLGGGFGATYTNEIRKSFSYYLNPLMDKIERHFREKKIERPAIVIEPGRSIVAEAGISLYEIGSIKKIEGVRTYLSVNGGMSDNIRPVLYGAKYTGLVANRGDEEPDMDVRVVGKFCESGDVLVESTKVPESTEPGDIFAVFSTGAYGYSMASNYNRNPVPAVTLIRKNGPELMVKRQSYEQLIKNDMRLNK